MNNTSIYYQLTLLDYIFKSIKLLIYVLPTVQNLSPIKKFDLLKHLDIKSLVKYFILKKSSDM